ncbi:Crp/Fnr family transcriptional regulator [bacterium]|nr:Crp/Fnr family transcriptional regulator [bacterium]
MTPQALRIADFPLFAGLQPADADLIETASLSRHYAAGNRIFQEGESARWLYLVRFGSVKIFKLSPRGGEHVLAVLTAGQTFAEAPVFSGGKYPANSECVEDCELVLVDREALLQLLARDPDLGLRMLAGMALKLRKLVATVEDLTLRDARGRLARYLLGLRETGDTIQLPIAQGLLARLLGLTGETLSRTFRGLRQEGVLEHDRSGLIQVLDWTVLELACGEEIS